MVPRCLRVCELVLEQEGVYGVVQIEDLHLGLLPLDSDIISLESPDLLKSIFMVCCETISVTTTLKIMPKFNTI